MVNIVDFFDPGDIVTWNKEIFNDEKLFPTILTVDVYGEGPFKIVQAEELWVPADDTTSTEDDLKRRGYVQWIKVEGCGCGSWQNYFFKLVKG